MTKTTHMYTVLNIQEDDTDNSDSIRTILVDGIEPHMDEKVAPEDLIVTQILWHEPTDDLPEVDDPVIVVHDNTHYVGNFVPSDQTVGICLVDNPFGRDIELPWMEVERWTPNFLD